MYLNPLNYREIIIGEIRGIPACGLNNIKATNFKIRGFLFWVFQLNTILWLFARFNILKYTQHEMT